MTKTGKLERYRLGVGKPLSGEGYSDDYWETKSSELYPEEPPLQREKSNWFGDCAKCGKKYQKNKFVYVDRSSKPSKVYHPRCYHDLNNSG